MNKEHICRKCYNDMSEYYDGMCETCYNRMYGDEVEMTSRHLAEHYQKGIEEGKSQARREFIEMIDKWFNKDFENTHFMASVDYKSEGYSEDGHVVIIDRTHWDNFRKQLEDKAK